MRNIIFMSFLVILFVSCGKYDSSLNKNFVVKVYDKVLTKEELTNAIPGNISKEDSIAYAERYIHEWTKKELISQKARLNISEDNPAVKKMIEDYKSSLLTNLYLDELLRRKATFEVEPQETEQYYIKNKSRFLLSEPILRGMLVIIPLDLTVKNDFHKLLASNLPGDYAKLQEYCYTNARKFEQFSNRWVPLTTIQGYMNVDEKSLVKLNYKNKILESSDSLYRYFLKVDDFKLKSDTAPLGFIREKIVQLLKEQKRREFLQNFERELFNNAIKNQIIVYPDDSKN